MSIFAESIVEPASIDWLKNLGYTDAFGPENACDNIVRTRASLRDPLLPKSMRGGVRVK